MGSGGSHLAQAPADAPDPSAPPSKANDFTAVIAGLVLCVIFVMWLHTRLIGVSACWREWVGQRPDVMNRRIVGFHQDELGDWVADLEIAATQHVRHNPPWTLRPWGYHPEGRAEKLSEMLACKKCDEPAAGPST